MVDFSNLNALKISFDLGKIQENRQSVCDESYKERTRE